MDEFGTSIRHSDKPTVKCAPFFYLPTNTMFSIIWPIEDLKKGGNFIKILINFYQIKKYFYWTFFIQDELTRDYVYGIRDETLRKCKLIPWIEDYEEELANGSIEQKEPNTDYFNVFFYNYNNNYYYYYLKIFLYLFYLKILINRVAES